MNKRRRYIAKRRRRVAWLARLMSIPRSAVVCAWCSATMRRGSMYLPVSHGICSVCVQRAKAQEHAIENL